MNSRHKKTLEAIISRPTNMTNTMNYKGYYAKVEFDPRNDIFVGRVLGIEDSISFHGATVRELHTDFKAAIETAPKQAANHKSRNCS